MDLGLLLKERERWNEAYEAFSLAQEIAPSAPLLVRLADLFVPMADWQGAGPLPPDSSSSGRHR
jgi:hypothetical protein